MDQDRVAQEDGALERHRPYVRELDRAFGQTYGIGGTATLIAMGCLYGILIFFNWMSVLAALIPSITLGLICLAVLRRMVNKKRSQLRARVLEYCETNGLDSGQLHQYYAQADMYPYFIAILDPNTD